MPANCKRPDRSGKPVVHVGVRFGQRRRATFLIALQRRSGDDFMRAALPGLQFELLFGTCGVREV